MKSLLMSAVTLLALGASATGQAAAVLDMGLDGYVGNAQATIEACKKIAPTGTKKLAAAIDKAVKSEKQSIDALRKQPGFAKEFKKETDRWFYMSEKNRHAACKKLDDTQYP